MKNIVVPIDFTSQTEAALEHALIMAKQAQSNVVLLNLVKSVDERDAAIKQMENLIAKHLFPGVSISPEVRVGLVEDIGNIAAEFEANLVFLGTHGLKGLQYVFGSKAL